MRLGGAAVGIKQWGDPQVVLKVLGEKTYPSGVPRTHSLRKIWCPLCGVECKDLGENRFLFTFLLGSDKRRALEYGPLERTWW